MPSPRQAARAPGPVGLLRKLRQLANPAQARILSGFFKAGPGDYGEGDQFLGIKVPAIRALLASLPDLPLETVRALLESPIHEARFLALVSLVRSYGRADANRRKTIFRFYLDHAPLANNWDLVDASAPGIVGRHLPPGKGRAVLARLAHSACLWERRIAMVSSLEHIRRGDPSNALWLAELFLDDPEDLMHKAAGWMLREAGKRSPAALDGFLLRHAPAMPRTMLRYAIERLPPDQRRHWMLLPRAPRAPSAKRKAKP